MQKIITLLVLVAALGLSSHAFSQRSVKKLFCDAKKEGYSFAMTAPGWLVRKGINLVTQHTLSEDKETWIALQDKIKGVRFMISEKSTPRQKDILRQFASNAPKENWQLYASFSEGKNKVQLLVEEKKNMIKNFLFLIMGEEESIIVQIKTELSLAELEQKNFSFQKNKKQP